MGTTRLKINKMVGTFYSLMFTVLFIMPQLVEAKPDHKPRFDKPKYRVVVHRGSNKACFVLFKKRTSMPKNSVFASNRRFKYAPMAETEGLVRVASWK